MSLNYFNESGSSLVKSGLLYYDGQHKDSKGNPWNVSSDQIYTIVENTNNLLQTADIPVFKEHNKTVDNQVGTITTELEAREITTEDANINPKLKSLVGKVGIFCDNIEVVDEGLIEKIQKGIGKGISIGIDFANNVIRELSFVGLPALAGATVFKSNTINMANFNTGITLDDVIQSKEQLEENREEGHKLLDSLFDVINNINELSDEELQGQPREALYESAIQRFTEMIPQSLPMMQSFDAQMYQDQEMMAQGYGQQGMMQGQQMMPMRSYARKADRLAEFFYNPMARREPEKKKSSLLGTIGKVGLGAVGVAGAGLGLRAGAAGLRAGKQAFKGVAEGGSALGSGIGAGLKAAGTRLKKDVMNPMKALSQTNKQLRGNANRWLQGGKKPRKPDFMNSPQTINIE
jgi:hypothetical protein